MTYEMTDQQMCVSCTHMHQLVAGYFHSGDLC